MEVLQRYEHGGRTLLVASPAADPSVFPEERHHPSADAASGLRAPGAGRFEIDGLAVRAEADGPMLTARITGTNIAYIYTESLLKDKDLDRFYGPVDRRHVVADRSKQTLGVDRPIWDDPVEVAVAIRPRLRLLTDGVDSAFCFSVPESYRDPDHRIGGLYDPIRGNGSLRAVLTFDDSGRMKRLLAYGRRTGRSGPRTVDPRVGDRFAPLVQVFTAPIGGGDRHVTTALSTTLTFSGPTLTVKTGPPLPGEYLAGLVVQDLDGRLTREYVPLSIEPGLRLSQ